MFVGALVQTGVGIGSGADCSGFNFCSDSESDSRSGVSVGDQGERVEYPGGFLPGILELVPSSSSSASNDSSEVIVMCVLLWMDLLDKIDWVMRMQP